jgi:hypothetical protein
MTCAQFLYNTFAPNHKKNTKVRDTRRMQTLSKGSKTLRRTLGALSLAFMASTGTALADGVDQPGTTMLSNILADIQKQANTYASKQKAALPDITIIDIDHVNTLTRSTPVPFLLPEKPHSESGFPRFLYPAHGDGQFLWPTAGDPTGSSLKQPKQMCCCCGERRSFLTNSD